MYRRVEYSCREVVLGEREEKKRIPEWGLVMRWVFAVHGWGFASLLTL